MFIRRLLVVAAVVVLLVASGCAEVKSRVGTYGPGELKEKEIGLVKISQDTVWQGRIRITGDVLVDEGVTLTIMPGTVIRFDTIEPKLDRDGGHNMMGLGSPYFPGAEIIVRGRILAVGTADSPIVFTSSDPMAKPGIWGAINLLGSNGNVVEYCKIFYAYNGVHNHASTAVVLNNIFSNNGTAISFKKADYNHPCWMFIEHNIIKGNLSGIAFRYSIANIAFNDISDNKYFGIWIKEGTDSRISYNNITGNGKGVYLYKAPFTRMNYNNIYGNVEYNIALAELNPEDVDATMNWWGTTDGSKIAETIFDHATDDTLGTVHFEPMMKHRVTGTLR
jgi:parallel beta-helix repeat protein